MGITTLSFSERLDSSRTILAYYIQNENDFVAYNSVRFTPSWKTNWNAAIVAAESVSTDENIVDLGTDRTATVIQVMEEARQNSNVFLNLL